MTAQDLKRDMQPTRSRHCAGFSIMELMVVLTIGGIMLAAAIPNFASCLFSE